jgi:hypothetical protein
VPTTNNQRPDPFYHSAKLTYPPNCLASPKVWPGGLVMPNDTKERQLMHNTMQYTTVKLYFMRAPLRVSIASPSRHSRMLMLSVPSWLHHSSTRASQTGFVEALTGRAVEVTLFNFKSDYILCICGRESHAYSHFVISYCCNRALQIGFVEALTGRALEVTSTVYVYYITVRVCGHDYESYLFSVYHFAKSYLLHCCNRTCHRLGLWRL